MKLSKEFINKYKGKPNPFPNNLAEFVYYRTYSRWLPKQNRREMWWETVKRAVEFNCGITETLLDEAERLYDNIYNLKQFLSGRTMWIGGTEACRLFPMANFNCSFVVLDDIA